MAPRGQLNHYVNSYKYGMVEALGLPWKESPRFTRLIADYCCLSKEEKSKLDSQCAEASGTIRGFLPPGDYRIDAEEDWKNAREPNLVIRGGKSEMDLGVELSTGGLVKNTGFSIMFSELLDKCTYNLNGERRREYFKEWDGIVRNIEAHGGNWADFDYRSEVVVPVQDMLYRIMQDITDSRMDAFGMLYHCRRFPRPAIVVRFTDDKTEVNYYDLYAPPYADQSLRRSRTGTGIILDRGMLHANVRIRLSSRAADAKRISAEVVFKSDDFVTPGHAPIF